MAAFHQLAETRPWGEFTDEEWQRLVAFAGPDLIPVDAQLKTFFDERKAPFLEAQVPEDLAARVTGLANLAAGLDIVRIDETAKVDIIEMGRLYYDTGERLGLDALRGSTRAMSVSNHWQSLAAEVEQWIRERTQRDGP